jgi:hypothetical protein
MKYILIFTLLLCGACSKELGDGPWAGAAGGPTRPSAAPSAAFHGASRGTAEARSTSRPPTRHAGLTTFE